MSVTIRGHRSQGVGIDLLADRFPSLIQMQFSDEEIRSPLGLFFLLSNRFRRRSTFASRYSINFLRIICPRFVCVDGERDSKSPFIDLSLERISANVGHREIAVGRWPLSTRTQFLSFKRQSFLTEYKELKNQAKSSAAIGSLD